ncbi:MAG: hypothetical protein K8E24_002965, partial [Methanobacterium paludis]|nr:hypothetical protein [Methanobacterium paludis]
IEKINKEIAAEEVEIELTSYDISKYKKGWTKRFEVVTHTDKLEREESALFKDDEHFKKLIKEVKKAEQNVYSYMDGVVTGYRITHIGEPKKESMTEKVARLKRERLEKEAEELVKKEGGVNHE